MVPAHWRAQYCVRSSGKYRAEYDTSSHSAYHIHGALAAGPPKRLDTGPLFGILPRVAEVSSGPGSRIDTLKLSEKATPATNAALNRIPTIRRWLGQTFSSASSIGSSGHVGFKPTSNRPVARSPGLSRPVLVHRKIAPALDDELGADKQLSPPLSSNHSFSRSQRSQLSFLIASSHISPAHRRRSTGRDRQALAQTFAWRSYSSETQTPNRFAHSANAPSDPRPSAKSTPAKAAPCRLSSNP